MFRSRVVRHIHSHCSVERDGSFPDNPKRCRALPNSASVTERVPHTCNSSLLTLAVAAKSNCSDGVTPPLHLSLFHIVTLPHFSSSKVVTSLLSEVFFFSTLAKQTAPHLLYTIRIFPVTQTVSSEFEILKRVQGKLSAPALMS